MMKYKELILLFISMGLIILMSSIATYADSKSNNDYTYEILADGTIVITNYYGSDENITIPSSIDGYNVSEIKTKAFFYKDSIKYITVSEGIKVIDNDAFWGCNSIKSIIIPKSIVSIERAFTYCPSLESISVDSNNSRYCSIEGVLYSKNKRKLISVPSAKSNFEIPSSVEEMEEFGFDHNNKITDVILPSSVKSIGDYCFRSCTSLKHFTFNNTISEVPKGCFKECTSLESVNLPEKLIDLGSDSFSSCSAIKKIELPNSLQTLGSDVFENCKSLKEVNLPNGLKRIYQHVFYGCESLEQVVIPNNITQIVHPNNVAMAGTDDPPLMSIGCFYGCINLKRIYIPKSVTKISAFKGYSSVFSEDTVMYVYKGSAGEKYAQDSNYKSVAVDDPKDNIKPRGSINVTNDLSNTQTLSFDLSDNVGVVGYYWGTNNRYSYNEYRTTSTCKPTTTVNTSGTYYLTVVDASGNVSDTVGVTFYKTTLNGNGASVNPSSIITKSGNSFTLPTPTKNGYTFNGWSTSSTAVSGSIKSISPTGNNTYYATWRENDIIKPTGSISATNNISASQTVTLKLSDNVGVAGYYWGTSSSYLSNTYATTSSSSVTKIISTNETYYLTVKDTSGNVSDTVSVTFYKTTLNGNGGSVNSNPVITKSGNSFILPTPARNGYTFKGWSTSTTATSATYQPGGSYISNSNTTLYAVWEINKYIVSYNANGGSVALTSQTKTYGTTLTLSNIKPTRIGYTFKGWSTSNTATSATYQPGDNYTSNNDITLYAVWQKKIDQNSNGSGIGGNNGINNGNTNGGNTNTNSSNQNGNTINKQTVTAKSKIVSKGVKAFNINAVTNGDGNLTYSSSNKKVVIVNSVGMVRVKGYGKATVTIKASATSRYTGAVKKITITVIPKKVTIKKVSSTGRKRLSVLWKKDKTITGYQIHFSTRKDFNRETYERMFKKSTTKMSIVGLKSKKKYYVRIRSYVNVGGKKYYSAWCKVKNVKIK